MPPLELDSLDAIAPVTIPDGKPLSIELASIDEDPAQPRTEFDPESLRELADSIAARGVLQPVSVRRHPETASRWILNFGARRLRASRLAGQSAIPAFVDEKPGSFDQVIENEHRDALQPMELALFVKGRLCLGERQTDIASQLGKSRAYVSYVTALIDPPDWLSYLYRQRKCRGVKELYDLRRLHDGHPAAVESWLRDRPAISRADISELQSLVGEGGTIEARSKALSDPIPPRINEEAQSLRPRSSSKSGYSPNGSSPHPSLAVEAQHGGQTVRVLLEPIPGDAESVRVVIDSDDHRKVVPISSLTRLRLVHRMATC